MLNNIFTPPVIEHTFAQGEEAVLCYLFHNQELDSITTSCSESFFHDSFRKTVYIELIKQIENTHEVDFVALGIELKAQGVAQIQNTYLTELFTRAKVELPKINYVLDQLHELFSRRQLITKLQDSLMLAKDTNQDITKLLLDVEESVSVINAQGKAQVEVVLNDEIVTRRQEGLQERYNTKGLFTGWPEFDKLLTVGFAPGKMSIIAGRTSMGKSFFKTNMIINMCNNGLGIMSVCPEQGFDSEQDRLDAIMTGIPLKTIVQIRDLKLGDPKFKALKQNSERIAHEWNYSSVPSRNITVPGVRAAIRKSKAQGVPVDVLFIDLFDRFQDVNVARDKTATIGVKLALLSQVAEEENVHMCVLAQVGRVAEGRKNKRPMLSDLRDSGNYEQDADLVMLLYREGYYDKDLNDNMLDVEIAKQRDGLSGVTFQFLIVDPQTCGLVPMGEKAIVEEDQRGDK